MRASDLTRGEKLQANRRRSGATQREEADARGVPYVMYRRWESDEGDPPNESLGDLKDHEVCYVLRRRAGLSLSQVAAQVGCSRWWACQMETGRASSDKLIQYWKARSAPWRPGRQKSVRAT